jgi:hypothetical protein
MKAVNRCLGLTALALLVNAAPASAALVDSHGNLYTGTTNFGQLDTPPINVVIVIMSNGSVDIYRDSSAGSFNGSGQSDAFIGVLNQSSFTLREIRVTGGVGGAENEPTFAFSGDGINVRSGFHVSNPFDTTTYGGPIGSFVGISSNRRTGDVRFNGSGVAGGGGVTYFSLENAIVNDASVVPEPNTLASAVSGLVALAGGLLYRRRAAKRVA